MRQREGPTAATPAPGQLRQRARSTGGAAPVEKVWPRLYREIRQFESCRRKHGRKHGRHSVEHGTSAMRKMAGRFPARGLAVSFELIHNLKEGTLILFRQGIRSIRAAMRAQLYEKSTTERSMAPHQT
jgi:hypothetical protein